MKLKLHFVSTLALLLVSVAPSFAQTDESSNALTALEKRVVMRTLSNGMRVIMLHRGEAPIFSGAVVVRVGGSDEQLGQTGISHMFEHMAFKGTITTGTKDYSKERKLLDQLEAIMQKLRYGVTATAEQQTELDRINTELARVWDADAFVNEYKLNGSSDLNATTDAEFTKYMVGLPRSAFELWCWMESERLLHPVMRQFYQERDVVMEERRMRNEDSPEGALFELLLGTMFTVHPYGRPVIGYPFDVTNLTASDLDQFRKLYYVPSNITLGIVGDVHPERDLALIERYFGRMEIGPPPPRPRMVEPPQEGERVVTLERPVGRQIAIAYRKPNYPDPDDAPLGLLEQVLAGGRLSPLYKALVLEDGVATSIGTDTGPGDAYPGYLMFYAETKAPHSNDEILIRFDRVIERIKREGFSAEEIEIAKRDIAMNFLGQLRDSMHMALNLATAELLYPEGWRAIINWYDLVMKVNSEDLKRVANKYLKASTRTIGRIESSSEELGNHE